jgi:hypothetical protein
MCLTFIMERLSKVAEDLNHISTWGKNKLVINITIPKKRQALQ